MRIDFARIDLVGVDFVRVDLVALNHASIRIINVLGVLGNGRQYALPHA